MSDDEAYLNRLRALARKLEARSGKRFPGRGPSPEAPLMGAEPFGAEPFSAMESAASPRAELEAIIRWSRPVLWINRDEVDEAWSLGVPDDADQDLIAEMNAHRAGITGIIPSVGRIELRNNLHFAWCGTGWIVDFDGESDIVITNAHVAEIFAQAAGGRFTFRPGIPDPTVPQDARIDFREEISHSAPREFPVTEVIWVSPGQRPDVAFLRVAREAGDDRLAPPVPLAHGPGAEDALLAVIGYPGKDDRAEYADRLASIFGSEFGIKRLALGRPTPGGSEDWITHDCSTLPGSSGSVIWDATQGAAAGLHFAGTAFTNNFAVPARKLREIIRTRPWHGMERPASPTGAPAPAPGWVARPDGSMDITVPLTLNLRLGDGGLTLGGAAAAPPRSDRASAEAAAPQVAALARGSAEADKVLAVRAEYLFDAHGITDDLGVVVAVAPGAPLKPADYGLAEHHAGVRVVVETADPVTIAEEMFGFGVEREAFRGRRAAYERDLGEPRFSLAPVTDRIRLRLCVSPEAGWPVLREFLSIRDYEQLTIGMYHVTAPHVITALLDFAGRSRPTSRLTLTLDRQRGDLAVNPDDTSGGTKADDIPERETLARLSAALGDRFSFAKASLGSGGLFPTAYHIKVAVWTDRLPGNRREDKLLWLSSGNWQSSNQQPLEIPPADAPGLRFEDVADYNREWHAVIEHPGLAATFRAHLEQDQLDNALASAAESRLTAREDSILVPAEALERPRTPGSFRAFAPLDLDEEMTVQPLLTPDNYPEVVLSLVGEAQERLWIQNQSFNLWKTPEDTPAHFLAIAEAIRDRQRAGVDVRILFRNLFGSERNVIRRLKAFGMETGPDHLRYFPTNHTKGMVIDGQTVMLGSQNLTAAGTGPNRDASLVIRHPAANAYFAELFEHDWTQYGENAPQPESRRLRPVMRVADGVRTEAPQGYVALSLGAFLGEG